MRAAPAWFPNARRGVVACAGLVLMTLALAGCRRAHGGKSDLPAALRMGGLERTGAASVLSWKTVPGAAEYGVTVVGEDGTKGLWVWTGSQARVEYGVADLPRLREDTTSIPVGLPPRHLRSLRPGGHYRWMVVALDPQGHALGVSDIQHFTAPAPPPPAPLVTAPTPGRVAASAPDVSRMLGAPSASACDLVPREKLKGMLGRDPGQPERVASSCRYEKGRLVLVTGPTSIFEGVRAMLKISPAMVTEVPGVGDGAYWMELPLGGQLTAKKGAAGASVTVMDSTLGKQRSLELAKALAAALLETTR